MKKRAKPVLAWGMKSKRGKLARYAVSPRIWAIPDAVEANLGETVIRVEIREVRRKK
jgi:hypothetical protein